MGDFIVFLSENYRSDKRVKGGITDNCKLCGQLSTLRLSHIAPKWMYDYLKSESSKRIIKGNYPSIDSYDVIHQDGGKHYLLCDKCEQSLGDAENHVKMLMTSKENVFINTELIQRFLLGLAYKSHFATSAPFHKINIRQKYLGYIKESLLKKEFRETNFFITAIEFTPNEDIDPKGMVVPGWDNFSKGTYLYTLLGGGWEWFLFINKNNKFSDFSAIKTLANHKLEKEKDFIPLRGVITDHRLFRKKIFRG
jgi:hypothetical protein